MNPFPSIKAKKLLAILERPALVRKILVKDVGLRTTMRGSYSEMEDRMKTVRVIYHHEDGSWWAESPDVERWYAAGDSYAEVAKLAEEGIPFALNHEAKLEHYVPFGESVPA